MAVAVAVTVGVGVGVAVAVALIVAMTVGLVAVVVLVIVVVVVGVVRMIVVMVIAVAIVMGMMVPCRANEVILCAQRLYINCSYMLWMTKNGSHEAKMCMFNSNRAKAPYMAPSIIGRSASFLEETVKVT